MCVAVPAQLVELGEEETATADLHGSRVEVSTVLVPEARAGDWVLLHAGFAIQRLDAAEAEATWAVLRELEASAPGGEP